MDIQSHTFIDNIKQRIAMKKVKEETKTKKYFVAHMYGCGFTPHVEFVTDSRQESEQFAALVRRNNPEKEYIVLAQI